MAEDGSKLTDAATLADSAAQVELVIPIAGLTRLTPLLSSTTGVANSHIGFSRDRGHVVAQVRVSSEVEVICQRCLRRSRCP